MEREVLINFVPESTEEKLLFERHFNGLFVEEIKKLNEEVAHLKAVNETLNKGYFSKKNANQKEQITGLQNCLAMEREINKKLRLEIENYKQEEQKPANKTIWQKLGLHRS